MKIYQLRRTNSSMSDEYLVLVCGACFFLLVVLDFAGLASSMPAISGQNSANDTGIAVRRAH